jgi:UDP-glucose 4-epimerase
MSDPRFFGSKILITGASGFLGANLRNRLLQCGAEVHATSRFQRISDHARLRWWQCDLSDIGAVHEILGKIRPEVIYHLSGQVTAAPDLSLVFPTFHSLLQSTVNVLTVVTEMGCRRLVITGSLTEPEPGHIDAPPSSPYAAAKWACNVYGRMFHKLYGTPVVILRPFMTYGPGQNTTKIIPYVILSLLQGKAPELSSGQWQVDWVYVDDMIDGFLAAAFQSGIVGCTIDLGSGTLLSVHEVVNMLTNIIDPNIKPLFGVNRDRPFEYVRCADTNYAQEKLHWKPTTSFEQGILKTFMWYKKQPNVTPRG